MYSQLGSIIFSKAFSPTTESDSLEISWAEMELINQPTKLSPTGRGLVEMNIEIFMHQSFCKVDDQIKALTDAAVNFDVLPFILGNGKLVGDFVIATIAKTVQQKDELGNLIAANVTLTLKEYIADKLQTEQKKADKNAFATGKKTGVTGAKKEPPKTCKNYVSDYAGKLRSYRRQEESDFSNFQLVVDLSLKQQAAFKVKASVAAVKRLSQDMLAKHSDCLTQYVITSINNLITTCDAFTAAMSGGSSTQQSLQHQTFQTRINNILTTCTAANVSTITRR